MVLKSLQALFIPKRLHAVLLMLLMGLIFGCKGTPVPPAPTADQIFVNPPTNTAFGTDTGAVSLSALEEARVVCYTTDGTVPGYDLEQWECRGDSTQQYIPGVPIALSCDGAEGVIFKSVRLFFTWHSLTDDPARTQEERQASFSLDCGNIDQPEDADSDGIADLTDNCPAIFNPLQEDADDDGIGNECDTDGDNDGIENDADNCPAMPNTDQSDYDKDSIGDVCDSFSDFDADTLEDNADNCPLVSNFDQADIDGDGIGDACDAENDDRDADGHLNISDNCPDMPNVDQADLDGDGLGDACDNFADNDGDLIENSQDNCPQDANNGQEDTDQDNIGNVCDTTPRGPDSDNDSIPDMDDNCPAVANPTQLDTDGDGQGDACEPAVPVASLHGSTAGEEAIMAQCLVSETGSTHANAAEGVKLEKYVDCLRANGLDFDPLSAWWVAKVDEHCFGAVNWRIGGVGYHHTPYLNCFKERGINPSSLTVNADYDNQVYKHCWGDHEGAEEALSWIVVLFTEGLTFGPGSIAGLGGKAVEAALFVTELGFDIKGATENGGLNLFEIQPNALTNYKGYQACLSERNIPGYDFEPIHTKSFEQLQAWTDLVDDYCFDAQVRGKLIWRASDLRQCYLDHDYPEAGVERPDIIFGDIESIATEVYKAAFSTCRNEFDPHTKTSEYMICFRAIGVQLKDSDLNWLVPKLKENCAIKYPDTIRGKDANDYRACIELPGSSLTPAEEANLAQKITGHCDGSFYVGGRFQSFGPYWKCYEERGTRFANNTSWQNGVRSYCSSSNMRFNHKSGYQLCLQQRQVSYIDSLWRADVKTYCDNSIYVGSRFKSYGPYFNCFAERGTTFVNDATWQNGVREYCANSNVRFGQKPGHLTCIGQRQVSFDHNQWCSVVKPFCDGLLLPGNRKNCMVVREC